MPVMSLSKSVASRRLSNGFPANKLVLGIPTYGRTWKLDEDSKVDAVPPEGLDGAGAAGPLTKDAGILSYPEICVRVAGGTGNVSPAGYRKVPDTTHRRGIYEKTQINWNKATHSVLGSYAYKPADEEKEEEGIWIAYEDPESAASKAAYVKSKGMTRDCL